jgi:aspartyl-tRNA(Asn)/glutamyl-tRNA(Gln) amidotransferase subunit C
MLESHEIKRIAKLARIKLADGEDEYFAKELSMILDMMNQLSELNTKDVEPLRSVSKIQMRTRPDIVTDGDIVDLALSNAPAKDLNFYLVPKVIE